MLRAHRNNARQFSRTKGSYSAPAAGASTRISVLGRRKHSSGLGADTQQPSLLRLKRQRLTKEQLIEIQNKDHNLASAAINQLLTPDEISTLSELQQEITGGYIDSEPPCDPLYPLNPGLIADPDDDSNVIDNDDDDAWEDVIEDTVGTGGSAWSKRTMGEHEAWLAELPALCNAYLDYRANASEPLAPSQPSNDSSAFSVTCIDLTGECTRTFAHPPGSSINATLLHNGYLGSTPERPSLAISILLLRIMAAIHRRGPSVSIQVMSKVFCDLRNVPYQPYFRVQLTCALDAFHMIRREVKRRLTAAMGGTARDLQVHTACSACTYKLKNEPNLLYSMLVTCDGNDSLKRCAAAAKADLRRYDSDFFIPRAQVDRFQHEVPNRTRKKKGENNSNNDNEPSECEKRWKNAKVDNNPEKKTKTMFHETGVFVCSCRHGFVVLICDMVRSGEQAKYGLAVIDRLIELYGDNIMMGYDIGCTFKGTAERSPLLGPRIKESQFDMCVGSFHGPAHNRRCQLRYHPHNITGTGLTDFENCETIFSSSNRIAGSTRLSSAFHRHQRIDNHFDGWNDDAHQNLGSLLRSKYTMALQEREAAETAMLQCGSSISTNVLDTYFRMEGEYIESMKKPPAEDLFAVEYLTLLEALESKEKEYTACQQAPFVAVEGSSTADLRHSTLRVARLESRRRTTLNQYMVIQDEVKRFEDRHGILTRWTRFNKDWANADRIRKNQHFHHCIDELERLVVQRVFELSRVGLANTGYKLQQHIMKGLIARSKAVKAAMTRYNKAASELDPPASTVTWKQIASTQILSEFELLRGSRENILEQDWAKPNHRRLVNFWHRLQRAEEEIERLNVEVRRVRTMIHNERRDLPLLAARITKAEKGLGWAANEYVSRRLKVNALVDRQLKELVSQPAYTGTRELGTHTNRLTEENVNSEDSLLSNDIAAPNDPSNMDIEEPNGTQSAVELSLGETDEETISEQLGQWHLALARVDSDVL